MAQGIIKGPKKELKLLEKILDLLKKLYQLEINENNLKLNSEMMEEDGDWQDKNEKIKLDDSLYSGTIMITSDDGDGRKGRTFTYLSEKKLMRNQKYYFDGYEKIGAYYIAFGNFHQ